MATAEKIYGWVKKYLDKTGIDYTTDKDDDGATIDILRSGEPEAIYMRIICTDFNVTFNYIVNLKVEFKPCANVLEYFARINSHLYNGCFITDFDDEKFYIRQNINCIDKTSISDDLFDFILSGPGVMWSFYGDGMYSVMSGEKTPKEAVDEVFESINEESCSCGCGH